MLPAERTTGVRDEEEQVVTDTTTTARPGPLRYLPLSLIHN